ncbi:PIN domain-containing protein [Azorhizobium sp. AG788]|uniref:PIN domain-containing protein n=1 Tax=Azorhizobium sp. AG788 TaxID=2183897 RepID=UPI00313865CE
MTVRCFVDTNVLICLHDRSQARLRALTRHSLRSIRRNGELVVSAQVMQEFYALAARRFPFASRDVIRDFLRDLLPACHTGTSSELMGEAWRIEDRFKFDWWECLMVASAVTAQCRLLVSDAIEDGLEVERTLIVNPFKTDIETVFATLKDR